MAYDDELAKAIAQMREATERARGYADFFEFAPDRDIAEVGVVESLAESLARDGTAFFTGLQSRGRGNDRLIVKHWMPPRSASRLKSLSW
jgi:hypothetical protein